MLGFAFFDKTALARGQVYDYRLTGRTTNAAMYSSMRCYDSPVLAANHKRYFGLVRTLMKSDYPFARSERSSLCLTRDSYAWLFSFKWSWVRPSLFGVWNTEHNHGREDR